jgi:NAD(P)-dependent dehydrogenase (short-subunit alcohol dehydrogenase family)
MLRAPWLAPPKGIRQLRGKVAVVTGASSGIGHALALGLWARGCHLALVDLDADGLARTAHKLRESGRQQTVTTHVANVGDRVRMQEMAGEVVAAHGAVHVLINNAGIAHEAAFPQTSLDQWDRIMEANVWGVIHGCHFFMPHLAKADRAHIVNMSSLLGIVAMAGQSAYSTSKFAVRGLSESLWEELRATSVGLTVVHPGGVATNIMNRAQGDDPELLQRLSRWYERHALPPERAAAKIIRAIERGAPRLLITREARFGDLLKRLMPVLGNKLFGDLVIKGLGVGDMRAKRLAQWRTTMVERESDGAKRERQE